MNVSPVNTTDADGSPCLSEDGLTLYLETFDPTGASGYDLKYSTRANLTSPFTAPVALTRPPMVSTAKSRFPPLMTTFTAYALS